MKLLGKFFNSLKYRGVKKTILKAFIHFKPNTHKNWVEGRFTKIYQKNSWGSDESISGPGSTLEATEILRNELPIMFKKFSINSVFDAPCGDFNWMQSVVKSFDIEYIGGDIVKELVETNNKKYSSANVKFLHIDIINQSLPKVDLFLCRDCLYHFSYQDSEKVIQNFINSNISYLLVTNHLSDSVIVNEDIATGSFKLINLLQPPYNFPKNFLYRIDDFGKSTPIHLREEMLLFSREQILSSRKSESI